MPEPESPVAAPCAVCGHATGVPQAFLDRPREWNEPDPPRHYALHAACERAAYERAVADGAVATAAAARVPWAASETERIRRATAPPATSDGPPLTEAERDAWLAIVAELHTLLDGGADAGRADA